MSVPAIRIKNFTKRYGKITAVDGLTLDVPKGSIFGLLGQNGAGKTTMIRTMLNLLRPTEGSIEVLGLDSVKESLEVRKRIGYLPEEPTYYTWMTVDEIVGKIRAQNAQVSAGSIGQPPFNSGGTAFQLGVQTQGRLSTPEEFGQIVIKRDGLALTRLADVARMVEEQRQAR